MATLVSAADAPRHGTGGALRARLGRLLLPGRARPALDRAGLRLLRPRPAQARPLTAARTRRRTTSPTCAPTAPRSRRRSGTSARRTPVTGSASSCWAPPSGVSSAASGRMRIRAPWTRSCSTAPRFDHRGPWWESKVLTGVAEVLGLWSRRAPSSPSRSSPTTGACCTPRPAGPDDFNLAWKPHHGFAARAAWAAERPAGPRQACRKASTSRRRCSSAPRAANAPQRPRVARAGDCRLRARRRAHGALRTRPRCRRHGRRGSRAGSTTLRSPRRRRARPTRRRCSTGSARARHQALAAQTGAGERLRPDRRTRSR